MAVKRLLSALEVEEKLTMGLCLVCDEPWTVEHQSAHKAIRYMMIDKEEDTEPEIEECDVYSAATRPNPLIMRNPQPQSSMNRERQPRIATFNTNMNQVESSPLECHYSPQSDEDGAQKENENETQKLDMCFSVESSIVAPIEASLPDHRETLKDDPVADPFRVRVETGQIVVQVPACSLIHLPCFKVPSRSNCSIEHSPRLLPPPEPPDRITASPPSHNLSLSLATAEQLSTIQCAGIVPFTSMLVAFQVFDETPKSLVIVLKDFVNFNTECTINGLDNIAFNLFKDINTMGIFPGQTSILWSHDKIGSNNYGFKATVSGSFRVTHVIGITPNSHTFNSVLNLCFCELLNYETHVHIVVSSSINMHFKYGCIVDAFLGFEEAKSALINHVTYSAMIDGFLLVNEKGIERALPNIQLMDSSAIANEDARAQFHPNRSKTIVTTPTTPFAKPALFEGFAKIDDTTFTMQFYCGYVLDDYEGFEETDEQMLRKEDSAAGLFCWTWQGNLSLIVGRYTHHYQQVIKDSLLLSQLIKLVAVVHRKMINRGSWLTNDCWVCSCCAGSVNQPSVLQKFGIGVGLFEDKKARGEYLASNFDCKNIGHGNCIFTSMLIELGMHLVALHCHKHSFIEMNINETGSEGKTSNQGVKDLFANSRHGRTLRNIETIVVKGFEFIPIVCDNEVVLMNKQEFALLIGPLCRGRKLELQQWVSSYHLAEEKFYLSQDQSALFLVKLYVSSIDATIDKEGGADSAAISNSPLSEAAGEVVYLYKKLNSQSLKWQKLNFKFALQNHEANFLSLITFECQNCHVVAVFHRKMIDRGRTRVPPRLLKWNTFTS